MSEARFLVLEDDPPTARHLARLVCAHGAPVVATCVREAMKALDDEGPLSGLILDVGLPDGSGLDVLAQNRKTRSTTPALVLTGDTKRETINAAYEMGAAYLVKPVELKAVEHFLARAIDTGFSARVHRVVLAWMALYSLSNAEGDVLRRASLGEDRRVLAEARGNSERTVGKHVTNILRLTGDASLHAAVERLLREVAGSSGAA
jgi:DNA-binding NarL/FixJ family response regulator